MFQQLLSPVAGSLALSALVAALPLVLLFVLLGVLRVKAWKAALAGLASSALLATLVWQMPVGQTLAATTEGMFYGLFPILWILINALWVYQLTVVTGWFEVLGARIRAISDDQRILAILIAIPVGVLAATRPYSLFDQIANTFAFIGFSLPTFFTGLVLILIFSIQLDWLPFVYRADITATGWAFYWEHIKQSIMPVTVLGLFQGAALVRFVRSSVLDVIRLDYVTTARSKGIGERKVITRHVVRTALIPVVTLVALQMPIVFSGAIVTEQIFRVPGIGSLLITSMLSNDTPVVMGVTFVSACLVVIFNLIADILYGWLDPRIAFR